MGIFRSEHMKHGTLVVPADRARYFVDLVGAKCNVQFDDMNGANVSGRPYKRHIQRVEEMERILRSLNQEVQRIPDLEIVKDQVDEFLAHADAYKFDELEAELQKLSGAFDKLRSHQEGLQRQRDSAAEAFHVCRVATRAMAQVSEGLSQDALGNEAAQALLGERRSSQSIFGNVAGVLDQAEQLRFAKALFRFSHGNVFTHFEDIDGSSKAVFVVYYQDSDSAQATAMRKKVQRLCASFGVSTYPWPANLSEARKSCEQLRAQRDEHDEILAAHTQHMREEAQDLVQQVQGDGNSKMEDWRLFCMKEKALYVTLNLFEATGVNLRADCWYPEAEESQIRAIIIRSSEGGSSAMLVADRHACANPPTYIRTNEYTAPYQQLVDTYGLPRYHEANPMLLTVVTFPFLFGVMFGDVGHGLMLLAVGLGLIFFGDPVRKSCPTLHGARYMLTAMGFFAVWMGFLYNDVFSLGFDFFGSRWQEAGHDVSGIHFVPAYDAKNMGGQGPYPFGVDPAWHGASNELIYMNSLKMKMSVIIGVVQMSAGLALRWGNAWHEGNGIDLACECLPMTVFMICFFGFMDFMIMYKWVTPLENPPSIINAMISMGMFQHDPNPMFGATLPFWLMIASVLVVPVMLLPKPLLLLARHNAEEARQARSRGPGPEGGDMEAPLMEKTAHGQAFEFGDVFIHQIIETIEYVLGTVSHTASYLRLWALSLAHQQLSLVFFQKTLLFGMTLSFPVNILAITLLFAFWFAATVGILLGMDVMECFLHTLRLHWVEFQSKFYRADGHGFAPYSHRQMLLKSD